MKFSKWFYILTTFLGVGFITSCEENNTPENARWYPPAETMEADGEAQNPENLYGNWVCDDFLSLVHARKTVRGIRHRPFFLEIVFKPEYGDSALLITGYSDFFARYTRIGADSVVIKNVNHGKDIVLYAGEGLRNLQLEDYLAGAEDDLQTHTWMFSKKNTQGKSLGALYALTNQEMLAGQYSQNGNTQIQFLANGKIEGWPSYSQYSVCNGGDCFANTRTDLDIIELQTADGHKKRMGFMVSTTDTVYMYALKPLKIKENTYYVPDSVAHKLARQ